NWRIGSNNSKTASTEQHQRSSETAQTAMLRVKCFRFWRRRGTNRERRLHLQAQDDQRGAGGGHRPRTRTRIIQTILASRFNGKPNHHPATHRQSEGTS
ncbi:MAG: hypothetical protein ACK55Z_30460, partial [bacterium]